MSPSPRREWIEIKVIESAFNKVIESPSPRREWIEILKRSNNYAIGATSPSPRREWIEMLPIWALKEMSLVSLPTEGVD